jgi:hypothetical protein
MLKKLRQVKLILVMGTVKVIVILNRKDELDEGGEWSVADLYSASSPRIWKGAGREEI